MKNPVENLTRAILHRFDRGVDVDRDTCHQLESQLGSSEEDVVFGLDEEENPEHDWLVRLLFSPGRAVRRDLEPALGRAAWSGEAVKSLADKLGRAGLECRFHFASLGFSLCLPVSRNSVEWFLGALNLETLIPSGILECLEGREDCAALRSVFRGVPLNWSLPWEQFFIQLIENAPQADEQLSPTLEWLLNQARQWAPEKDPEAALAARRQWCLEQLRAKDRNQEKTAGTNMETRMALGIRPPYVDEGRMRHTLERIDHVYALLGWPLPLPPLPAQPEQSTGLESEEQIRQFIRERILE